MHHTAGTNSYTRAQSAAIVRGIMVYHVQSNGWDDIGYNFLVDRYGQVFEGRYGGIERNVVGAHAGGFNTGTVGIAVIGSYGSSKISAAAQAALTKLIAWRMDVAHADPLALPAYVSSGNERFPKGAALILRGVIGHRDTGYTSCPGTALEGQLGAVARAAVAAGGPKLFEPSVSGAVGGPVRFSGRFGNRSVDGDRHRLCPQRRRVRAGDGRPSGLDVGDHRRGRRVVHVVDRRSGHPAGDRDAAQRDGRGSLPSRFCAQRRRRSRRTRTAATTRPRSRIGSGRRQP